MSYLDPDVAYLLGLIAIRGMLYESQGDKRIIIEFPYRSLTAQGISINVDQGDQLDIAVNHIRDRLDELLEADVAITRPPGAIIFTVRFLRNSIGWRNIRDLMSGKKSYKEFEVPRAVRESTDLALKTEFMRGVADAGGFIRKGNRHYGKQRVYIEVNNRNWTLPVQLCALLQEGLDVPVQMIQWGHPNVRQPKIQEGDAWAKEHQIKIFAEAFVRIGFHVRYKQKILEEFVAADRQLGGKIQKKCNPNVPPSKVKQSHTGEGSSRLPRVLRGKHFDGYREICRAMGCTQCPEIAERSRRKMVGSGQGGAVTGERE